MTLVNLQAKSKKRWKGDEAAEKLTWGAPMTGHSLWSIYGAHRQFGATDRVLEIGVGYGRLLRTALDSRAPFASYTGLELSRTRVDRLASELGADNVEFVEGDIEYWRGGHAFDVVLCSSTFEHIYPDCQKALCNIRSQIATNSTIFIDFLGSVPRRILGVDLSPFVWLLARLGLKVRYFYPDGTYIRFYDDRQLRDVFSRAGFEVRSVESFVIGESPLGPIKRLVVVATPA